MLNPATQPSELIALEKRRRMAEALLSQGMDASPVQHPLQAIARVVQAWQGDKQMKEADQGIRDYEGGQNQKMADALLKFRQQSEGMPGVAPATPMDDEGSPMPSSPPVAPDRNAALGALLNSGVPTLQNAGMAEALRGPRVPEAFTLKPGETRYGADGKPMVSAPFEPKQDGPKRGALRTITKGLDEVQQEYDGSEWVPIGGGPRFNPKVATTNVNVGAPKENFKNEKTLRDEFNEASKSFIKVRDAYGQVKDALSGDITAASTLAGATKFMKMLDPESVVRESELNMALKSTGLLDRFTNLHNMIMKGGVLTPKQAQEIQRIAGVLYNTAEGQQKRVDDYYTKLATDYELDPARVVRNLAAPAKGLSQAEQKELADLRARFGKR